MNIKITTISDEIAKRLKKLDSQSVCIIERNNFEQNTVLINMNGNIRIEIKDNKIIFKSMVGGRGYVPVILHDKDFEYIRVR